MLSSHRGFSALFFDSWQFGLLVVYWSHSTKLLYVHRVSTWMGDCQQMGKPSRYVTSHPGQLSLAIPPWVGAVSESESWGVNSHTA